MNVELVIATRNKKKLEEIEFLLKDLSPNLKMTSLLDYPEAPKVKEDGKSFDENAIKKALTIARFTKKLTLGEDSGIEVDALEGKPGIYSSRFGGRAADDRKNNAKLLRLLKDTPLKKRYARYNCSVAIANKDGLLGVSRGSCRGVIAFSPKGSYGFGYDPLFIIPKYKKTFAQLGPDIKHKMSHRAKAIQKAKKVIQKYLQTIP